MTTLKAIALAVLMAIWVYLAPIKSALLCVAALPVVDMGLAVLVSIRKAKPKTLMAGIRIVESGGMGRTIDKILRYVAATVLCYIVDKHLLSDTPLTLKVLLALIGTRELKSALEHLDALGANPLFAEAVQQIDPSKKDAGNK